MRHVRFTVQDNEDFGMVGYVPNIFRNWANYMPFQGLGHDLIDHTTKEHGHVWQELRAFGANLFITEFGGLEGLRFNTKGEALAMDLESILRDAYTLEKLPMARKVSLNSWEKDEFNRIWADYTNYFTKPTTYADSNEIEYFKENGEAILSWFKLGYVNAKRRYDNNAYCAYKTKKRIDEVLQESMSTLSEYVGTSVEFSLSIDVSNMHVELSLPKYV